ncbi:MAG: hypothetical protein U1D32_03335, partial [Patescibacteria group bacterium]|nr:hypothetical protein [Patescibacteria group bacterium]
MADQPQQPTGMDPMTPQGPQPQGQPEPAVQPVPPRAPTMAQGAPEPAAPPDQAIVPPEPMPPAAGAQAGQGVSLQKPSFLERFFAWRTGKQNVAERSQKQTQAKQFEEAKRVYEEGISTIKDLIAPAAMEITFNYLKLEDYFVRTLFVFTYPRYINTNWLNPIINYDVT